MSAAKMNGEIKKPFSHHVHVHDGEIFSLRKSVFGGATLLERRYTKKVVFCHKHITRHTYGKIRPSFCYP